MKSLYKKVYKNSQICLGSPREICEYKINESEHLKVCEPSKSNKSKNGLLPISGRIFKKAQEEAAQLIADAKEKSRMIIEDAKNEAFKKSTDIKLKAKKDGYHKGLKEAEGEYAEKLRKADDIIKEAKDEHDKIIAGIEREVLDLALSIAQSIIGRETVVNKEYIVDVFKQGLESCYNRDNVILKASMDDYQTIERSTEELLSSIEGLGNVKIVEDRSLSAGDCIIETPFGSVNAGIDKKFEKLKSAFEKILIDAV